MRVSRGVTGSLCFFLVLFGSISLFGGKRLPNPLLAPDFHGEMYLMRAIASAEYRRHMTTRSPRWGTVGLPVNAFRTLVKPFTAHLQRVGVVS